MSDLNGPKRLVRTRDGRVVAGVCSGLGQYFGIDANLVRLIFALVTLFTAGVGLLVYLAGWMLIPEEDEKETIFEQMVSRGRR